MNKKLSNNIKIIRKSLGITVEDLVNKINSLGQDVNISTPHLYSLERGSRRLSQEWMNVVSTALGCKPEDLISEDIKIKIVKEHGAKTYNKYSVDENGEIYDEERIKLVTIPLYDIRASAGHGQLIVSSDVEMQVVLTIFNQMTGMSLKSKDVKDKRFSFIQVDGDSMEPYIENGNLLLIDHDKTTIEQHRQVLVFRDGGNELYIKEVHKPYGNKLSIISYNPAYKSWIEQPREKVLEDFCGEINIVGKVIWHGNKTTYFKGGSTLKV